MVRAHAKASKEDGHAFSIELKSKDYVKRVAIPNESGDCVLIEGFLGELKELSIIEEVMLEIRGSKGTFRMDLNEEEIQKCLKKEEKNQR